ncbi:unnamed protein product [Thlaspi arvense]|uniref:Peroxidase n=1 Tax=Thlaspi arvense TaxID=13288 RepID=A0AAU9SV99_THLAR|nr:unnamed protein product [Thlaspi arvense]
MGFGQSSIRSFMILIFLFSYRQVSVNGQNLTEGFYSVACPLAETIARATIRTYFLVQPNIAPGLLKLHYSDCFVEGCDGSVLISGPNTERTADANLNLRGFEVIEDIKRQLEVVCPGVVSCADILALAARDAVVLTNGPSWDVKSGRKDGRVSLAANVKNLPSLSHSITVLLNNFAALGLNTEDFVALFGGHTIGTAACRFITDRIFSTIDLTIDPLFLAQLQSSCPINGSGSSRVALDTGSELVFDTSIFKNILNGRTVLKTDQILLTNPMIYRMLQDFVTFQRFNTIFTRAMAKMSGIGVKTELNGEIRRNCSKVN